MLWSRIDAPSETASLRAGQLRVDLRERTAALEGKALDLSPLLFDLLVCLVERPGSVVTRGQLKRALWPYAERIDTERRLNTAVRALRVALGDDGATDRFIETVRSHGYRWIAAERTPRTRPVAAALAVLFAAGALLAFIGTAERPTEAMALVEAQAAVDAWRQQPTAGNLTRAAASVDRAGQGAEVPAIHLLRAQLAFEGRWDWAAAEAHYRRALALDEDNADALLGLAWLEANRGRTARALALVEQLAAGSALGEDRRANLGWLLIRLDRPDLAAATCRASDESSINLLSCAHVALAGTSRVDDARRTAVALMEKVGASAESIDRVRDSDADRGYAQFLQWRARDFLPAGAAWFHQAQVLADAGRRDEALDALDRSVAAREPLAIKIGSSPSFASLRSDPRFRQLAQHVGVRV
jgi:DNA-binding winged helix-turn-helix (wHTH) protein/Tfp pilus assembly protein PilF